LPSLPDASLLRRLALARTSPQPATPPSPATGCCPPSPLVRSVRFRSTRAATPFVSAHPTRRSSLAKASPLPLDPPAPCTLS
jgi:hypothetical protein